MKTIFAYFDDHQAAVRALGALHDHGVSTSHMSLISGEDNLDDLYTIDAVERAREGVGGVTLTSADDAATGALKGTGLGLGVGFLGGLASLFIPGFGLVFGGGALATATGAALGSGVGGLVAGGITGYLKDQGLGDELVGEFQQSFEEGGAVVGVDIDATTVEPEVVERVMAKYDGRGMARGRPTLTRS